MLTQQNMGDSLELIGKRLFLLLADGRSANGGEPPEKKAGGNTTGTGGGGTGGPTRDWLRGTVRAVSVIGLAAPEVGGGEAPAAGLTVSCC